MLWITLARVVEIVVAVWLAALLYLVVSGLVRGRIAAKGLLADHGKRGPTVTRMQLLLVTVVSAAGYAGAALVAPPGSGLPDVPDALLPALAGSNGIYLLGKTFAASLFVARARG